MLFLLVLAGTLLCHINDYIRGGGIAIAQDQRMAKKRSTAKRASTKRDLVKSRTGKAFAKRTAKGRFKEMDNVKRSLSRDRPKKAKRKVKSGYGDQGDR